MATPAQIGAVVYDDEPPPGEPNEPGRNVVWRIVFPDPPEDIDHPRHLTEGADRRRVVRLVKLDAGAPDWSQFAGVADGLAGFTLSTGDRP